ncbi:hypothetical protein B0O99DRAFT_594775 [Bisporella sp. PMI_857]|nr:hypothetical protein B0O99DRAFT_594775 [Bisporella sp. PMI_857]
MGLFILKILLAVPMLLQIVVGSPTPPERAQNIARWHNPDPHPVHLPYPTNTNVHIGNFMPRTGSQNPPTNGPVHCDVRPGEWKRADAYYTIRGIADIYEMKTIAHDSLKSAAATMNDCKVKAKSCVRLACRESNAIYLCNDRDVGQAIDCDDVVLYAFKIRQQCNQYDDPERKTDISGTGQVFSIYGWNVVIRKGKCSGPVSY